MHNQPPPLPATSVPEHAALRGIVVCAHVIGVGVYLPDQEDFGHVNASVLGLATPIQFEDYPAVGTLLSLTVFGRSPAGQLRLGVAG
jgi:hypothetical protein